MIYKLFWHVLSSHFLTAPWFYAKLPDFTTIYFLRILPPPPSCLLFLPLVAYVRALVRYMLAVNAHIAQSIMGEKYKVRK